jgi:D-sedoheptulose 7-phosphate isomerase
MSESHEVIGACLRDQALMYTIAAIAGIIEASLRSGGKVLLAGNGGSAADAQHIAGELVSRLNFDRSPLAAIALTTDSSVLTAIGNDYGYEQLFSRQILGLGRKEDVFVAISTSGRSPNVLAAVSAAKGIGMRTIAFTGSPGGVLANTCAVALRAPSASTPLIQQVHITAAHAVCALVENSLFGSDIAAW